jgi:hypothetical protein
VVASLPHPHIFQRMTSVEFRGLLAQQTDQQLLAPCLHDDQTPYVFDPAPANWDTCRALLVAQLGIAQGDIRVVGSARFGFSTKPGNNLRGFQDTSDIDLIVVNADLFDRLWIALLVAAYPREPILQRMGGWLNDRRNELYTGWLSPLKVRVDSTILGARAQPVLAFNVLWFNALKQAAQHAPRRHEDMKGRLYRTWRHAELYHLHSLGALRRSLTP